MSPIIPRETYRREHFDNSIESARTVSKYALSNEARAVNGIIVAYAAYLDVIRPDWRDLAVRQIQQDYPDPGVELTNLKLHISGLSITLRLNDLIVQASTTSTEEPKDE